MLRAQRMIRNPRSFINPVRRRQRSSSLLFMGNAAGSSPERIRCENVTVIPFEICGGNSYLDRTNASSLLVLAWTKQKGFFHHGQMMAAFVVVMISLIVDHIRNNNNNNNNNRKTISCTPVDDFNDLGSKRISWDKNSPVLGVGSYGIVRLARDKRTNKPVALKIVNRSDAEQDGTLRNEIEALKLIHDAGGNKGIVELVGCIRVLPSAPTETEKVGLAFEFISGGELYDSLVEDGAFSEKTASRIISEIANSLVFLHEKARLVHADIKPENLLLTEEGYIKIIDFGCAAKIPENRILFPLHSDRPLGTVGYAAPELLNPTSKFASSAVDVWSLGVVLYILLSGQHPFDPKNEGLSDEELTPRILKGRVSFDSDVWNMVSPAAKDLISRMLTYDANKRITAREILQHRWISDIESLSDGLIANSDTRLRGFQRTQRELQNHILTLFVNGALKEEIPEKTTTIKENEEEKEKKTESVIVDLTSSEATTTQQQQQQQQRGALNRAFTGLDKENKGFIRARDIRMAKGQIVNANESDEDPSNVIHYGEMKGFLGLGDRLVFQEGDIVFSTGDAPDSFFFIDRGMVEVLVMNKRITTLGEGDFFGETGLLTNRPRNATIRCLKGPVELVRLSKQDFDSLVGHGWRRGMQLSKEILGEEEEVEESEDVSLGKEAKRRARRLIRATTEAAVHLERISKQRADEHVAKVLDSMGGNRIVSLKPNEVLFKQGEVSNFVYVVLSGVVQVQNEEGEIIAYRSAGDTIGEIGVLNHSPRSATISCSPDEPCTLKEFSSDELTAILRDPECAEAFRRKTSARRSKQSRIKAMDQSSRSGTRVVVVVE